MIHRLLLVPVLALIVLSPALGDDKPRHRHLHAALFELREARRELRGARHDFNGHRDKALMAIDDAIGSLKMMLRVKDDDIRGLDRNRDFYRRHKDHPRLRQALADLRDARNELRDARDDFGGMKKRAMRDINYAIDQIQILLKYARA